MRKFATLVMVMLIISISACSGKKAASPASPSGGDVIVNFYEHSDNDQIVALLVEKFNALKNGIKVVSHIISNEDYDDKIRVLIAGTSGEMDALWIRTPAQAQQFIANNVLADISGYAAESGVDLSPIRNTSLKGISAGDKFYGFPTSGSCWMLFYNKDLFDEKGLPYPVNLTWDQYMDLAKQLTYTEGTTKYWGGTIPPWTMNLGASAAGEYLTAPAPMEKTRLYAQALHRMYVEDKSHPGIAEMSVGTFNLNALFNSGNLYMMINGDWCFQLLDSPFEYGVAPMPIFSGIPEGSSVGQSSYFSVTRNSTHPKEAYKFIEFCTTSTEGTAIYAQKQNVPSYPTDAAMEAYKEIVKVPGVEFRFSALVAQEQGTEPYYGAINEAFIQELQLYLLDEQSLDKMFNNFFALRKEIIDNY